MSRPIPEKIANPAMQCIDFWLADYATFHAKSMYAVQNYGSSTATGFEAAMPKEGDSFSWRSGGDLYDYTVKCAGYGGIVDGYMPVNNWYATQKPVLGDRAEKTFFFDVAGCNTQIIEDSSKRSPTFREMAELSDLMLDLADELDKRQVDNPYQFVAGKLFSNPYFTGETFENNET